MRCKIFYQRDYVSLLIKYGLESPSAAVAAAEGADGEPAGSGGLAGGAGRGLFDLSVDDDPPGAAAAEPTSEHAQHGAHRAL